MSAVGGMLKTLAVGLAAMAAWWAATRAGELIGVAWLWPLGPTAAVIVVLSSAERLLARWSKH